jgi:hypothetical protein
MTETELLNEISVKRFIGFTKDDTTETFASRNKLAAYDLIEETKPNHWILTKDGYKANDLGFDQWMKLNGNSEMTLYDKIPLQLERGHFIDIIPLFPDESYEILLESSKNLQSDGIIELKRGGAILGYGDKTISNPVRKLECRLLRDNKPTHTTVIDKSIKFENSFNPSGDATNNINQSFLDNALASPIIQKIKKNKPTKPPKKSWLEIASWTFGIIAAIIVIYEFWLKHLMK